MDWYTKLIEDMNNHALRDYPREACGIILKDFTYVPCKNAAFQEYKFLVGFNMKFFIYWMDKKVDALKFEPFEERHCIVNN